MNKQRIALLTLSLFLLLTFSACSQNPVSEESATVNEKSPASADITVTDVQTAAPDVTTTSAPAVTTTSAPAVTTTAAPAVTEPTLSVTVKTEPDAISASEKKARQGIYDHMVALANMEWTPNETFDISTPSSKYLRDIIYEKGTTYRGAPYTNGIDGTMQMFADALVDGVYMGGITKADVIGFDCSSAVAAAWKTFNPNLTCESTKTMLPKDGHGCEPVGSYDYAARGNTILTTGIPPVSGEQVLFEAYALLHQADGVVCRWAENSAHIRMVCGDPKVVRNDDGSIDGKKSYIYYTDQTSTIRDFDGYKSNWQIEKKATFSSLFKGDYIPVCIEDFYVNHTQDLIFTVYNLCDGNNFPSRLTGQYVCTQKIMEGKIAVHDMNGNEIYSETKEIKSFVMQLGSFSVVSLRNAVGRNNGRYIFSVSARTPGTDGEFVEVSSFKFAR